MITTTSPAHLWAEIRKTWQLHIKESLPFPQIGRLSFPGWAVLNTRYGPVETMVYPVHGGMGWPPYELGLAIRKAIRKVHGYRPHVALWVPVLTEHFWFERELRAALWRLGIPVAFTPYPPDIPDFTYPPAVGVARGVQTVPPPASVIPADVENALAVLCRWRIAHRREVRHLFGRDTLRRLLEEEWIEEVEENDKLVQTKRRAVIALRRHWHIPTGTLPRPEHTASGNRNTSSGRHRYFSRLWALWLRARGYAIEHAWSEVYLARSRMRPDAVAIGKDKMGREAVFFLEVISGHKRREEIQRMVLGKIWRIAMIEFGQPVYMYFHGPPWVVETALEGLNGKRLPPHMNITIAPWR